jgi:hypothetical protein
MKWPRITRISDVFRYWRPLILLCIIIAGCSAPANTDVTRSTAQRLAGSINISGQARDAHGAPLPGVLITLAGPSPSAQAPRATAGLATRAARSLT